MELSEDFRTVQNKLCLLMPPHHRHSHDININDKEVKLHFCEIQSSALNKEIKSFDFYNHSAYLSQIFIFF